MRFFQAIHFVVLNQLLVRDALLRFTASSGVLGAMHSLWEKQKEN